MIVRQKNANMKLNQEMQLCTSQTGDRLEQLNIPHVLRPTSSFFQFITPLVADEWLSRREYKALVLIVFILPKHVYTHLAFYAAIGSIFVLHQMSSKHRSWTNCPQQYGGSARRQFWQIGSKLILLSEINVEINVHTVRISTYCAK